MASSPVAYPVGSSDRNLRHLARELLRLRNERQRHFPIDATGPAWDLMLALFEAAGEVKQISVGDLVVRTNVARTTAVRWLRQMQRHGLATLTPDVRDKRLVRVAMTDSGCSFMESLLGQSDLSAG